MRSAPVRAMRDASIRAAGGQIAPDPPNAESYGYCAFADCDLEMWIRLSSSSSLLLLPPQPPLWLANGRLIGQHGADLAFPVTPMAPQRSDGAKLARFSPPSHGLRVDTECCGDLSGRQQRGYGYGFGVAPLP